MFDAEKLSAARWAVRDILQYLKNNHRVNRTLVEKAVRRLNEVGFEDSASMLEAEFRPVFQGKKITTELSSSIQSLYDGVDTAISERMNDRAATELKSGELPSEDRNSDDKPTEQGVPSNVETVPLKTGSTTDIGSNNSTKKAEQAGATNHEASIEADDKLPKKLRKDSPSRVKAKAAHDYAMERIPNAQDMTIAELHAAILGDEEVAALVPKRADIFGAYLRDAGIKRYKLNS